jgi:hypothetical protein
LRQIALLAQVQQTADAAANAARAIQRGVVGAGWSATT